MNNRLPPAPKGSGPSGRKLWRSVVERYEPEYHEELILVQACRTADLLDRLAERIAEGGLVTTNSRGDVVADPAVVEHRQQAGALSRLIAQLRLPDESGHRGQRRGAPRGSYQRRAVGLHDARTDLRVVSA